MMKKSVPANQDTRIRSLGAISPYKVTNTLEKKEGVCVCVYVCVSVLVLVVVEEEEVEVVMGIFCQAPLTGACVCVWVCL